MAGEKEYYIVRDQNGIPLGKREVVSKKLAQNVNAFVINGDLIYSISEYEEIQDMCKNLKSLEDLGIE